MPIEKAEGLYQPDAEDGTLTTVSAVDPELLPEGLRDSFELQPDMIIWIRQLGECSRTDTVPPKLAWFQVENDEAAPHAQILVSRG